MKLTVRSFSMPYRGQVHIGFEHKLRARSSMTPEGVRTMRILYKIVGNYFSYSISGGHIECSGTLPSQYASKERLQAALDRDANTKLKVTTHDLKVVGGERGERVAPLANVAALAELRKETGGKCNVYATMFIRGNLPLTHDDYKVLRDARLLAEFSGPAQKPPFNMGMSVSLLEVKNDPWRQLRTLMPTVRKLIV